MLLFTLSLILFADKTVSFFAAIFAPCFVVVIAGLPVLAKIFGQYDGTLCKQDACRELCDITLSAKPPFSVIAKPVRSLAVAIRIPVLLPLMPQKRRRNGLPRPLCGLAMTET